ncbi:MAG: metallophosphoesterase [bacterium]|nr:metallophosphoesterase [bacterium]
MFNWLTHSNTRLRMLKMFFKEPKGSLYGLEIAQSLKASPGTTHRELNAMLKQGIITKKREGALVMYRLNTGHPYFAELKRAVFPKKKSTRILFVSDLHLTVDTPQDLIEDFLLLCDYAEENASELVLVGDVIEMLNSCSFQTYLVHKPVFDRLVELSHELKVTYLVGNHDGFLSFFADQGEKFFDSRIHFAHDYSHSKLGIYATHGHQYDDWSEMKGFKAKKVSPILQNLQKHLRSLKREGYSVHQNKLLEVIKHAEKAAQFAEYVSSRKIDFSTKFQGIAKDIIAETKAGYVVMGHTHKAQLKQFDEGIYFNTGSWHSEKTRQFVEIDNEGGALVPISELR